MNHSSPSQFLPLLAPFALCAVAHAAQDQESAVDPALPMLAAGPVVEDGVPAQLGSWFPSYGTPDGEMAASDEEIAARLASGFEPAPAPASNSVIYHDADETGMWLRARSYKAKASSDGFVYTPFLGSDAPRNFPVHFRLESAVLGGRELPLLDEAQVSRTGERFVLDRGAVDVIYDVSLDTVEQSFALDVAGSNGDLELHIDVETDLAFEGGASGGFRFGSEFGGMSYGTAIVLDGAGRQADVPASFDGGAIKLTVPASFLVQAEGLIVVDPVLGTFTAASYAGDQERPDIAYDRNTDSFIHVYEDTFSGSDGDVFFRRFDSTGGYIDQGYVDSSTDNWRRPSVANIDFLNRSLIACERTLAGGTETEIVGRFFRYFVLALEPVMLIGESDPTYTNSRPDVGGSWAPSADGVFMVTWQRTFTASSQLRYRLVRSNGTMEPIQFANLPNGYSGSEPAISKSSGNPSTVNAWNVALRVQEIATGNESIWNTQIAGDGSVQTPLLELLSVPSGSTAREIDISEGLALDGLAPTYLVSYDLFNGPGGEDKPIIVCRGGLRERIVQLSELEHTYVINVDSSGLRFATTSTDFLVSYFDRRTTTGPIPYTAYVTALDLLPFDNLGVSERRSLMGDNGVFQPVRGGASIASRQSGGQNSLLSQVNWTSMGAAGDWNIEAARHSASNATTNALQYCTSAPNSTGDYGFLAMYGSNQLTTNNLLVATALPLNSVGFFIVGNGFGFLTNPGGSVGNLCIAGGSVLGRYSSLAASSGPQGTLSLVIDPLALAAPTGTVAATAGSFWQFQCWHRDSQGGMPVSNFTNAVSIRFQN